MARPATVRFIPFVRLCRRGALWLFGPLVLGGCAAQAPAPNILAEMPALQYQGERLGTEVIPTLAPTPQLLDIDDSMREFVARYASDATGARQRLHDLHSAIKGGATFGVEYDPAAEGSASEVFYSQQANCLAFANLFIALAREARLDARYQWVALRPQWTRMGERVAVRLHVNAVVRINVRDRFMVDLDPLPARDIAGSHEITDVDAQALYHSNVAMDALTDDSLPIAWANAMRALQLSPQMPHLWVNLGVIYRRSQQYAAAEAAYLQALEIDSYERSAMNNLMVLYGVQQREPQRLYWEQRIARYRDNNPYYHAWLGDQAAGESDWQLALTHYREALDLSPEDADLLFSVGLIYRELNELNAALRHFGSAVEHAELVSERRRYDLEYERTRKRLLASQ